MLNPDGINFNSEAYDFSLKIKESGFESLFDFIIESHLPVLNIFHSILIFSKPLISPLVSPVSLDIIEKILVDTDFREQVIEFINKKPQEQP
jgi:hypothetical protein